MAKRANITVACDKSSLEESLSMPPDECIPYLYKHVMEFSCSTREWYWRKIGVHRLTSLLSRYLSFFGLAAGAVLPVSAALWEQPAQRLLVTQIGVFVLAAAGVLRTMDTVFGYSKGWMRYVDTVTQVESLTLRFIIDWRRKQSQIDAQVDTKADAMVDTKAPSKVDDTQVRAFFDLALAFQQQITALISEETKSWIAEFTSGLATLTSEIAAQRKSGQEAIDALTKEQNENSLGGIQVSWTFADQPSSAKVRVDDGDPEDVAGTSWSKNGLKPGTYRLLVDFIDQPTRQQDWLLTVEAGKTTEKSITLPALPPA